MKYAIYYIAVLIALVAVDFVWLTTMSDRLYGPVLGDMLAAQPRLSAAAVFYLLYAAGTTVFVGAPALRGGSLTTVLIYAPLFGLFCYMTYDLTNQATLRNWSTILTLADIAWGMVLTTVAASVAFLITRKLAPR